MAKRRLRHPEQVTHKEHAKLNLPDCRCCAHTRYQQVPSPMQGKTHSIESRAKMSASHKGVLKSTAHNRKNREAHLGVPKSEEHRQALSRSLKDHASLDLSDCQCVVHKSPSRTEPTKLAWTAYELFLEDFDIVVPEVKFGPYRVDFLLADEWLAIEVDGAGWHRNYARDCKRDKFLLDKFELPVVRLTQAEIREAERLVNE